MTSVFERAQVVVDKGHVKSVTKTDDLIWGEVLSGTGDSTQTYTPYVGFGIKGCGCVAFGREPGMCKHIAAIMLSVSHKDLITWVAQYKSKERTG